MTRLDQLRINQTATVTAVDGVGPLGRRLMALGLLPGVQVRLTRRAPLGDPIAIRLHGYELSLRCAEAATVGVAFATGAV